MHQDLAVAEMLPGLPRQCIYAAGPYCEDHSKHIVPYRYSPALRYPECLLQSSSYPFPAWTSSTNSLLFALHGNVARSMPYSATPFYPFVSVYYGTFFIFEQGGKKIFPHKIVFLYGSNDTMKWRTLGPRHFFPSILGSAGHPHAEEHSCRCLHLFR